MTQSWLTKWQIPHDILDCDNCDATFLHPQEQTQISCPLCGHDQFSEVEIEEDALIVHEPELMVPFAENGRFNATLKQFQKSIRIPPKDCQFERLKERLHLFYWPMWLVDVDVTAQWQVEAGFDYDAVTYGEKYVEGEWRSMQNKERRVRWEPRLGNLTRHYENQAAPALDEHADIVRLLGGYDLRRQRPYQAQAVADKLIRLPTRSPKDAWSDVQPQVQKRAAAECQEATRAQHMRNFKWSPQFDNLHWTQLLLPLMATFYFDDEGQKQMVYIHGQTGRVVGKRRASLKRAYQYSLWIGMMAAVLLGLTAVFWLIPLMTQEPFFPNLTAVFMFLTFCVTLTIFVPPLIVFYSNTFRFFLENQALESSLIQSAKAYWGTT